MRLERFETESNAPNAGKLYKHWKLTFINYLETVITAGEGNNDNQLILTVKNYLP